MRRILLFLSAAAAGFAEVRTVTLAQVLDLAMTQSAEAALARLAAAGGGGGAGGEGSVFPEDLRRQRHRLFQWLSIEY